MWPKMDIGGVQQNFVELMRYAVQQGHRVIWLYTKPMRIADAYKDLLPHIEAISYSPQKTHINMDPNLKLDEDEIVKWITARPSDMHRSLLYAYGHDFKNITPLYVVSNTKGRYNYIENYYWGLFKSVVFKKYRDIVSDWNKYNLIRYFDINHYYTYSKIYGIQQPEPNSLAWKAMFGLPALDTAALKERINRNEFNIISVTRFDFPHKQYLLGLIRDFAILKKKYPHIKLHIVGYGQHENIVKELIYSLPLNIKNGIILYGQMSREEISCIMKKMHLNISVAACVGLGAREGVLSIPARNFCKNECEVYGYLPDSKNKTVSTEPGQRALPVIEEVIKMSKEEYKQKCLDSYLAYEPKEIDPDYMLKQTAKSYDFSFEKKYNRFFYWFEKTRDCFWKIGDIATKLS